MRLDIAGVANKMFETLAENNINIQMISTSEIKISVLIQKEQLEKAVKALHTAFGLDREDGERLWRLLDYKGVNSPQNKVNIRVLRC